MGFVREFIICFLRQLRPATLNIVWYGIICIPMYAYCIKTKKGMDSCITFRFVGIYAAVCNRSTSQCHTSCNCKKRTLYGIQNHSNPLHRFDVDCNWCDRLYRI